MTDLADGYYAVPDPDDPDTVTRWRVKDGRLKGHPARAWYGPARPLRTDAPDRPGTDAYTAWMREFLDRYNAWRERLVTALEADPLAARRRFAEGTGHCCDCGRALTDGRSRLLGIGPDCFDRLSHDLRMAYLAEMKRAQSALATTDTKD